MLLSKWLFKTESLYQMKSILLTLSAFEYLVVVTGLVSLRRPSIHPTTSSIVSSTWSLSLISLGLMWNLWTSCWAVVRGCVLPLPAVFLPSVSRTGVPCVPAWASACQVTPGSRLCPPSLLNLRSAAPTSCLLPALLSHSLMDSRFRSLAKELRTFLNFQCLDFTTVQHISSPTIQAAVLMTVDKNVGKQQFVHTVVCTWR